MNTLRGSADRMAPIVHQTLAMKVYHDLRQLIVSGQLQPGERLTIAGVASALGTSAMPVREAISKLAAEEALELLPNKSVRVPVMTRALFEDLRAIRLVVEGLAVERAAARIGDRELDQLAALEQAFESELTLAEPNVNQLIRLNQQFHFTTYQAAGMPPLSHMIEGLWLRLAPVIGLVLRSNQSHQDPDSPTISAHRGLLDALRARDGAAARLALAKDINGAAEFILAGDVLRLG